MWKVQVQKHHRINQVIHLLSQDPVLQLEDHQWAKKSFLDQVRKDVYRNKDLQQEISSHNLFKHPL